jgi:peptidoglycan/xylan/chitin deacetylase (PgdA/CDA1 family)
MIGVAASAADLETAAEFFELFKTPWEPLVPGRNYPVVLTTDGRAENVDADVLLVYGSVERAADRHEPVALETLSGPVDVDVDDRSFPIYGSVALFDAGRRRGILTSGGRPLEYRGGCGQRIVRRVGYDLFAEVRYLLSKGQPARHAEVPTLDLHIEVLRQLLVKSGVSFVEIPPRPSGYDFACCLTHDLDFFGIRRHTFDRTLAGFLLRASVGTLADLIRGRRPLVEAVRNWVTLGTLPLVHLRLAPDFWRPFDDYARFENGLPSTFFVVPFKGQPGIAPSNSVDSARSVPYAVKEIAEDVAKAGARGNELAVHGIDAWRDADSGRAELAELTSVTGQRRTGVRMHWLYFSAGSPQQLENAGFDYDSTCGYNDAIGYRAGTTQVFRVPGTRSLMELPLAIMDTALFFRDRMDLDREEALRRCRGIVANARRFGGTVVINWHDRSLAAERLWGEAYKALLDEVQRGDRAWFGTAAATVDWFRWRRSIAFNVDIPGRVTVTATHVSSLPAAQLCVHRSVSGRASVEERSFDGSTAMRLEL